MEEEEDQLGKENSGTTADALAPSRQSEIMKQRWRILSSAEK
jgi:hypothetical protein